MTEQPKITFAELNLDPRIQTAIDAAGYEHPTPIQEQAIPVIKKGGDVTGIAQTGTGKTAAFTLPMMHRLTKGRARARMPRSLILCPTRELAAQVAENFETYGKDLKLNMALLIGGVSFKEQEQKHSWQNIQIKNYLVWKFSIGNDKAGGVHYTHLSLDNILKPATSKTSLTIQRIDDTEGNFET